MWFLLQLHNRQPMNQTFPVKDRSGVQAGRSSADTFVNKGNSLCGLSWSFLIETFFFSIIPNCNPLHQWWRPVLLLCCRYRCLIAQGLITYGFTNLPQDIMKPFTISSPYCRWRQISCTNKRHLKDLFSSWLVCACEDQTCRAVPPKRFLRSNIVDPAPHKHTHSCWFKTPLNSAVLFPHFGANKEKIHILK